MVSAFTFLAVPQMLPPELGLPPIGRNQSPSPHQLQNEHIPRGSPSPLQVHRRTWGTRRGSEVTLALTLGGHSAACHSLCPPRSLIYTRTTGPAFVAKALAPVSSARMGPRLRLQDDVGAESQELASQPSSGTSRPCDLGQVPGSQRSHLHHGQWSGSRTALALSSPV